jgi:hypothetical protein
MNRTVALGAVTASLLVASFGSRALAQNKPASAPVSPQVQPADATFAAWDTDHDGSLSQQEFRMGWQQARQALEVQAKLRQQFATIDANKSGAIEASEYGNLLLIKQAGKSAPPLATFDTNKDGKLQWAEYLQLVMKLAPQAAAKGHAK